MYGKDFYRKIQDKYGCEYAYQYFVAHEVTDDKENMGGQISAVMEADVRKALYKVCKKQGGHDLVKEVFAPGSSKEMIEGLLRGKSIAEATYATILSDPELNKVVGNLVEYKNPLIANMVKKPGVGDKAIVVRRTATSGGVWIADTDTLTEETGTYAQTNFTYKTLGTQGKLTRKMIAIGKSFGDILQAEITYAMLAFRDKLDYTISRGNNTSDSNEPDGLDILIPAAQVVSMTAGLGGASLTKAKMDEFIDKSSGDFDYIIASKAGSRIINSLVQTYQRFVDKIVVRGGMRVTSWDDKPIFKSTNMADAEVWNDTSLSAYTGGSETHFIGVDNDETWLEILTPITVVPLALVSSQYREFDIVSDLVIVIRNYERSAILGGVIA